MKKFLKRMLASVMVVFMLLSFAPINEAYAEYLKDLDISSWFSVKAGALDDIPSISCDIEWDISGDEGDTSAEDTLNRSEINYMKVDDGETFSTYSSGSDYSDNATTYTVLLLDIESAHNMLTYNGEYLCTLGSPVKQVKAAALKLIDQIKLTRGTTHVAIVTFCKNVRVVQNFTTDYYTMRKAIENITEDTAWTDVNGAFKKADELLSSVSETNVDKNIVLFTQGVPYSGEYSSSGRYTINDCSWKRTDNNIYAYQYSNSAYATAEALKSKYNIYSIGLYQSYEGIPEQGKSMLNFAKRVNQDIQNKGYYDVTNVDDLEFSFSQDVFNLAVAIDTDLIYIPVRALDSSGNEVPVSGAQVTVYQGDKIIDVQPSGPDGYVHFSRQELYNKGVSERSLKKCTVSAHYSVGEIELCSETVKANGKWIGENLLECTVLIVDEPRWYTSIKVGFVGKTEKERNERYKKVKKVLNEYTQKIAEMTNGHCIITDIDIKAFQSDYLLWYSQDSNEFFDVYIFDDPQNNLNWEIKTAATYRDEMLSSWKYGAFVAFVYDSIYFTSNTLCHESGHLLFELLDEYCYGKGYRRDTNNDGVVCEYGDCFCTDTDGDNRINHLDTPDSGKWSALGRPKVNGKPAPDNFGVMDDEKKGNIELSSESDYSYLDGVAFDPNHPEWYTAHYYKYEKSTEETVADVLISKAGNYKANYTLSSGKKQDAEYSYSKVDIPNYTLQSDNTSTQLENIEIIPTVKSDIQSVEFTYNETFVGVSCLDANVIGVYLETEAGLEKIEMDNGSFNIPVPNQNSRLILIKADGDQKSKEVFYINNDDGNVIVKTEANINSGAQIVLGNIYIVLDLKYQSYTVSNAVRPEEDYIFEKTKWYKMDDNGAFEEKSTTYSVGEKDERIYTANVNTNGVYVLLTEKATEKHENTLSNVKISNDLNFNGAVNMSFVDASEANAEYTIFYSTQPFDEAIDQQLIVIDSADTENISIYLREEATYYFTIKARSTDGSYALYKDIAVFDYKFNDTNTDGIPNSWFDNYPLVDSDTVATEDPDDDGLDNLTEYEYGTNPLNPDTDGDNVYDKVELLKGLDPLNPMTDGVTDDYVVAYGAPDLEICEITFDDDYIYFSVKNDTDSKAMRTLVEARIQDETIALWTVNVDEHSIVQFAIDRTAAEDWTGLVLEADGGKLTHDSDYSNNAFTYSAANAISLEDTEMVKRTSQSFVPVTEPDGANDIYRWSITEGNCLTSGTVIGEFTANKIGKATIKAETLNGLTADCLISVVSFEGAEYSEFDSELIDAGTAVSIVGYIGDDEHVVIPDTIANLPVTEIGTDAFYDCLTMKSVDIPSSVVALGDYAFDSCSNLSSITIGSNIREIGVRCFYRCINLETVYYNSVSCRVNTNFFNQRAPFDGCSALEKCIISDDVIEIPQYLFYDLSSLKEVEMGNNVEYIGNRAFSSCDNLEYICLPETLTSIGSNAFYGCSSLSNLILPEKLSSIGGSAFRNCSSIYSAIIPDSVSSIGSYAFSGCTNLTDISIANDIATVYENSFDNTAYFNDESNWENGILYIDNHLITGKADLINGVIKSGTVCIANSAFADNANLTRITIPKTVKLIGTSAFSNCIGLTSAVIPTGVEQIESSAFNSCTSLAQVSLYNKDCIINSSSTVFPETTILCGYSGSTLQEYATNFSRTFVSLHEHDYSYVVKVEPTVMNEGYIERSCSCGDAISEVIPAIGQHCVVKNNLLIGFEQGLSVEELLEKYLVSDTAAITLSRDVVGTGTIVKIINGDGICEEYEIVIFGDVNGDSWYDGQDAILVSAIADGLLTENELSFSALIAADCNADGKINNGQDAVLLQSAGVMIEKVNQLNIFDAAGNISVTFNGNGANDGAMEQQVFEYGVEQNLNKNTFKRSYKIAYELNDGVATITNANTDSVYSFKSWNSTPNGNGLYTYSNGEAVTNPKGYSSGNAELYAQWIGGAVRIPTPTKEYNEFVGWYTDPEFKNEFIVTDELYYPTDNITLYAKWQPHEFEVTFNDVFDFDTFDFSSALNGTVSVDKENKSVTLYSEAWDTHTTNYADSTRGYMTLIPGHTYRFSYDWENLSDVDETLHPYVFAYDSLEITELQMYNYYKLPAPGQSSGVHVFTETIPEGHPYVTIRFGVLGSEQGGSIIKCSNIHIQDITNLDGVADDVSVPMNANDETIFDVSVGYGDKISSVTQLNGSLPIITRTGYTFAGWYDSYDENGNGTGNLYDENSVMGATDLKLYAKWIKE